jgi:hypothetical protein
LPTLKNKGDFMKLQELFNLKNDAIKISIQTLECFIEPCNSNSCEQDRNPPYHWRGCEHNLKPIIDTLKKAMYEE